MMTWAGQSRHRDWTFVEQVLDGVAPLRVPIEGTPDLHLDIVPAEATLILSLPHRGTAVSALESGLATRLVREDDGARIMQLFNTSASVLQPFYAFCCEVADRVQMDALSPTEAIQQTLRQWHDLLQFGTGDSPDVGLFGELITLRTIAGEVGWPHAVSSWKGPMHTAHDFGLDGFDVEVKTVSGATRLHTIHGADQLVPAPGRPLWLVSHHVTRGGISGVSVHALANEIMAAATGAGADISLITPTLVDVLSEQSAKGAKLILRAPPLVLRVDDRFPVIQYAASGTVPIVRSYTLDVSAMQTDLSIPAELNFELEAS